MKSLVDSINEASRTRGEDVVNLIIGCSSSMHFAFNDIQDIYDFYNKPNLYLLDGNKITKFSSVQELVKSLRGGHSCSFDELKDFYKEHIGELNVFIQN